MIKEVDEKENALMGLKHEQEECSGILSSTGDRQSRLLPIACS